MHVLETLAAPVAVGGAACLCFYAAIHLGPLRFPFMLQWFAAHPLAYSQTAIAFVGFAALVIKLLGRRRARTSAEWVVPDERTKPESLLRDRAGWEDFQAAFLAQKRVHRHAHPNSQPGPGASDIGASKIHVETREAEPTSGKSRHSLGNSSEHPLSGLAAAIHALATRLSRSNAGFAAANASPGSSSRSVEGSAA